LEEVSPLDESTFQHYCDQYLSMYCDSFILFLDFDGVTHPDGCRADDLFCQLPLIEGVLQRRPGVQVVISSSWRETRSLDVLRRYFRQDLREREPIAHQPTERV